MPVKFSPIAMSFKWETHPADLQKIMTRVDKKIARETKMMNKRLYHIGVVAASAKTPRDRGYLKSSLYIGRRGTASYADENGFGVGSKLIYAPAQDDVARWHERGLLSQLRWWPNVTELRKWVVRKVKPDLAQIDSVTYLIGRKIARDGLPSHNFMAAAEDAVEIALKIEGRKFMQTIAGSLGGKG